MVSRADFVAAAREWLDTPYHHQGRLKGVGVDCGGVLVMLAKQFGLSEYDATGYKRQPDGSLEEHCAREMQAIPIAAIQPGDVLSFKWSDRSSHIAIVTAVEEEGIFILHAYIKNRKVVEHRLDTAWMTRISGAYHLPGVE